MPLDTDSLLNHHPIGVVAERTGLSQDVIRVWERRYSAVEPPRGDGGQRRYSDADIHRLRLLHAATRAGRSIRLVAALPHAVLEQMVAEDSAAREQNVRDRGPASVAADDIVEPAMSLARALNGVGLELLLRRAAATHGVASFLEMVVIPLLRRIGDEWHVGRLNMAQEHLASATVQYLLEDVTRAAAPAADAPAILMTTPSGERHQLGAVLAGATAAAGGWRVIYLGPDLPAADIANAAIDVRVRIVAISFVFAADHKRVVAELLALRSALPSDIVLIAGGAGSVSVASELEHVGIKVVGELAAFDATLRGLRDDAS